MKTLIECLIKRDHYIRTCSMVLSCRFVYCTMLFLSLTKSMTIKIDATKQYYHTIGALTFYSEDEIILFK